MPLKLRNLDELEREEKQSSLTGSLYINLIQIIQEYERAVIFRMGRIAAGGAKGPGLFFILPCTDEIRIVDQRTISFDVPPQEVRCWFFFCLFNPNTFAGLVGKVRKNYLRKEEGREGGEKKCTQPARRTRGSNPGSAAC